MKNPIKLVCAAIAATFALANAQAEYFYHGSHDATSQSSTRYSWSDSSHWTPNEVPGTDDSVDWYPTKTTSHRIGYFSLDDSYSVGYITNKWRSIDLAKDSSVAGTVTFTIAHVLGNSGYQHHVIGGGVTLVVPAAASLLWGTSDGTYSDLTLENGSSAQILGAVETQMTEYKVQSGSTLLFNPVSYTLKNQNAGDRLDKFTVQGGSVNFPSGLAVASDSNSKANSQQLNQESGVVTFGGDFTSEAPWTYTFSGGTLAVTDNSAFGQNIALTIPASASVTLDVATDKTFSAANFAADSTAEIKKTGEGTFVYAPTTAAIAVNEGGIGFASASEYDLSNVTFENDTVIALNALGATISAISATTENAKFVADLSGATAGTAILNSANSAVLEKAKADLEEASAVPAGFGLQISNGVLSLEVQSEYSFVGTGSATNILDVAGWGGSLPPNGADVAIDGEGVVATLQNGDSFPAWNSIEVKNGATLRIESSTGLIPIELNKSASLVIASGITVSLTSASDLSGIAVASQVPVLSIESDATLNVPGGMKFSNVNIDLKGEIASATAGGITFGYAAAGDTTYIGLMSDGGTISIEPGSGSYNTSSLEFCCPAAGGSVYAVGGSLTLADTTIHPIYVQSNVEYPFTVAYQIGLNFGVNNPASSSFEVLFDNTTWGVLGSLLIKGGATFRLANGGAYMTYENLGYYGRYAQIAEKGRLVIGSGCEFRLNFMGDYGTNALEVNPSDENYQSIVVEEGGIFETYRSSGNGKGVLVASNGVYRIFQPSIYNEHYSQSSGTTTIYDTTNVPFAGFSSVSLADGSTLTFSTRNRVFWEPGHFADDSGDRVVALADVPITGGGSIALDNANANVFGVVVKSGANEATGTASVVPPTEGEGATTLYFADGANWAGTVVADGNVALTNLVDAAAAVTNTFGTLRLDADFPIRVWKSGDTIVNDALNVDAYVNNGGKLVLVGDALAPGDTLILGTLANANALPDVKGNWKMSVVDGKLQLKYQSGLSIIFR